jgi:hypothetical protein
MFPLGFFLIYPTDIALHPLPGNLEAATAGNDDLAIRTLR